MMRPASSLAGVRGAYWAGGIGLRAGLGCLRLPAWALRASFGRFGAVRVVPCRSDARFCEVELSACPSMHAIACKS
jgi:hypothetical protein